MSTIVGYLGEERSLFRRGASFIENVADVANEDVANEELFSWLSYGPLLGLIIIIISFLQRGDVVQKTDL